MGLQTTEDRFRARTALDPHQARFSFPANDTPGASLLHARMRAGLANLDQGEFTEGHELDRKWRVPKEMVGQDGGSCRLADSGLQ
jgi:hypothetical protein